MQNEEPRTHAGRRSTAVSPGAAMYGTLVLAAYDLLVLGFSSRYVWGAPAELMVAHYNANVSANHLDVGVGTGYFLDRCTFPARPSIALLDENPNSLAVSAKRLARYAPMCYRADVLGGLPPELGRYNSIGVNYVLHCLRGPMRAKGAVFARLAGALRPGGRLFGSTILGSEVHHNPLGRGLMRLYNARGVFDNLNDDREALEIALCSAFAQYSVEVRGTVAFFTGTSS